MRQPRRSRADRALELSLLAALVIHAVALVTMGLWLLPAMPGAGLPNAELRFAYVRAHPVLWHLGWLPWHLSAVSDLFLSAALLRARWVPKWASVPTFALTVVAFGIEQIFETEWDLFAPGFPQGAVFLLRYPNYGAFETHVALPVTAVAAALYAVMAMGWSWSISFTPAWNLTLTVISVVAWPVLLFASVTPLLPERFRAPDLVVNTANQVGFALMLVWFVLTLEAVLRRTRVDESVGRMQPWRAPGGGWAGRWEGWLANSRVAQYVAEFLPKPVLSSHIHDVVYVNYLVDADRVAGLLPEELELQRLGPERGLTLFSVLVYRHGRFGPRALGGGASCRGFPSPLQSNWRLYVQDRETGEPGVFFVSTTLSKLLPAMLARMLSRGVPMHVPARSSLTVVSSPEQAAGGEDVQLELAPGQGSAPDLKGRLRSAGATMLLPKGKWSTCFGSYDALLRYAVPQGRALSVQSWDGRVTAQEIDLPAPPDSCLPLAGSLQSDAVKRMCGEGQPVCFLLPEVQFTMTGERVLRAGKVAASESR